MFGYYYKKRIKYSQGEQNKIVHFLTDNMEWIVYKYGKIKKTQGGNRMSEDLGNYLYKNMLEKATYYQWKIIVDRSKRALEIYFTISLDIPDEQFVQDTNAKVNESGQLSFEEVICFYDEANNKIVPQNYLVAIPINISVGVEQGYVDAFIKQLNIIVSNASGQIREYLTDESQNEFSLVWSEQNMENTIHTMQKTENYHTNTLTIEFEEKVSLIDQFKEENNGGMERI